MRFLYVTDLGKGRVLPGNCRDRGFQSFLALAIVEVGNTILRAGAATVPQGGFFGGGARPCRPSDGEALGLTAPSR
jgi:hypothetical protein